MFLSKKLYNNQTMRPAYNPRGLLERFLFAYPNRKLYHCFRLIPDFFADRQLSLLRNPLQSVQ